MLENKSGVVSGGSGAIGSAICLALARYGMDVAFSYHRQKEKAAALAAKIETMGRRCLFESVDGCDGQSVEKFCNRAEEAFGKIDLLVNNLGFTQVMPFALIEEDDWDKTIQINLKSMFLFTKALARGMIRRRKGVILNLGSVAGHRLLEVPVHYATAKAGVSGFTLSLAKEFARYGIRVNELCPGLINAGVGTNVSERQLQQYKEYCALGRQGTPEEIAETAAFLASDGASYINAHRLVIDGGL